MVHQLNLYDHRSHKNKVRENCMYTYPNSLMQKGKHLKWSCAIAWCIAKLESSMGKRGKEIRAIKQGVATLLSSLQQTNNLLNYIF